jgi:dUTP pyrophosphatase
MKVLVINTSNNPLPRYQTQGSAGLDLQANIDAVINPTEIVLVPTGLYLEIPQGYEAQIRPRSGLAVKHGITIPNAPGTIDSDYRGEIKVILQNNGKEPFVIKSGDRIAQIVFAKYEQATLILSETLTETERGEGGFGSTNK